MSERDDPSLASFELVSQHYLDQWGIDADKEIEWFGRRCRSLPEAIERAALSELPSGRGARLIRHSHQRRIPGAVLTEAAQALSQQEHLLTGCNSFHELFEIVSGAIGSIPGVGELLVYDVSHRIGGFLGLQPEMVYLHTGTRSGAIALGLETRRKAIPLDELPTGLRALRPDQIEDVLCIYRATLARLRQALPAQRSARPIRRC